MLPDSHSRLSPSKRHRWSKCPGSVRAERAYKNVSGKAAIDGTHSHTLLEACLINKKSPLEYIGTTLTDKDGEFHVNSDRAERVNIAYEYIQMKVGIAQASGKNVKVITESKVSLFPITFRSDLDGTVDVQIITDDSIEVIDYKDGMGIVDVEDNPQLIQYTLGALAENPTFNGMVEMTIIQPRALLKSMHTVNSVSTWVNDMMRHLPNIIREALATDAPDAPLIPGESQCKFCLHKGACPALMNASLSIISPDDSGDLSTQLANSEATGMSNWDIQRVLEAAPMIRTFIAGVEEEALSRFRKGSVVPGFKVIQGSGQRSWKLEDSEIAAKLTKMGIPKADVFKSNVISIAQAEKLKWTKKNGEERRLSKRQIDLMNSEYVERSTGSLKVVPESEKGNPVLFSIDHAFQPIE